MIILTKKNTKQQKGILRFMAPGLLSDNTYFINFNLYSV